VNLPSLLMMQGYYLSFTAPDELFHDAERLQATASVLLRRINGLGRMLDNEFLPVGLIGRFAMRPASSNRLLW
jgi:hypothetical protein